MAVHVRPLEATDEAQWNRLWQGYLEFYETQLTDEMTALTWSRLHDASVPLHGWVAELDGVLVGFTHAQEQLSTWSKAPYVYLEDLYVDQTARKCGAGSALINAVYAHADKIGSTKVYWQTNNSNLNAQKLYDVIGQKSEFILYQRR
ncbi:MAG: GNAT family N-acetyltransferase [Rhizobiaceae bacterium]